MRVRFPYVSPAEWGGQAALETFPFSCLVNAGEFAVKQTNSDIYPLLEEDVAEVQNVDLIYDLLDGIQKLTPFERKVLLRLVSELKE